MKLTVFTAGSLLLATLIPAVYCEKPTICKPYAYHTQFCKVSDGRIFFVIQTRNNASVSFQKSFKDYEKGFGTGNYWFGLENLGYVSHTKRNLRVEMVTWSGAGYVAEYRGFQIKSAKEGYAMNYDAYLTGRSNTSADSLAANVGKRFSTEKAKFGSAGWWLGDSSDCNPNGIYRSSGEMGPESSKLQNMFWLGAAGYAPLKSIRMMIEMTNDEAEEIPFDGVS